MPDTHILDDSEVEKILAEDHAEMCGDALYCNCGKVTRDKLCQTVRALRGQYESAVSDFAIEICSVRDQLAAVTQERDKLMTERQEWLTWADSLTGNQYHLASAMRRSLQSQLEQLRGENERLTKDNADLTAANIGNLLGEIKERLTPEEGLQFQSLLMAAAPRLG